MNKVMLIGNVGKEPEVKYIDKGLCVANLWLATTERGYKTAAGGEVPDRTTWHYIVFWGKLAEIVEQYVHTGDKLYVEGEIYYRTIEEKNGSTRRQIEITAKNMEMLTPRKGAEKRAKRRECCAL